MTKKTLLAKIFASSSKCRQNCLNVSQFNYYSKTAILFLTEYKTNTLVYDSQSSTQNDVTWQVSYTWNTVNEKKMYELI